MPLRCYECETGEHKQCFGEVMDPETEDWVLCFCDDPECC